MSKYTDKQLLEHDPFDGDMDVDVQMHTVKIVTTKSEHDCMLAFNQDLGIPPHKIKPGARARFERALVDGKWGHYWVCLDCMANWLDLWFKDQK